MTGDFANLHYADLEIRRLEQEQLQTDPAIVWRRRWEEERAHARLARSENQPRFATQRGRGKAAVRAWFGWLRARAVASVRLIRELVGTETAQERRWLEREAGTMSASADAEVQIKIPIALRRYSDGVAEARVAAPSVGDALNQLVRIYPQLRGMICDELGQVRRHINIFRDSDEIRYLQGLATPLAPGTTLTILPAVSGGE